MTFKGSIVVKKTDLLYIHENQNFIFRSKVSKESKMYAWGMISLIEDLLGDKELCEKLILPSFYDLPIPWDTTFSKILFQELGRLDS